MIGHVISGVYPCYMVEKIGEILPYAFAVPDNQGISCLPPFFIETGFLYYSSKKIKFYHYSGRMYKQRSICVVKM